MQITRENCVGDVAQKLQEIHPEHSIRIKNHLLKLTNEQKISNVMDKEDILTAFIQEMKEMEEEEEEEDFFVVIQSPLSKRRLFLTPRDLSKLDLHNLPYSQQIAVCWLVTSWLKLIYYIIN